MHRPRIKKVFILMTHLINWTRSNLSTQCYELIRLYSLNYEWKKKHPWLLAGGKEEMALHIREWIKILFMASIAITHMIFLLLRQWSFHLWKCFSFLFYIFPRHFNKSLQTFEHFQKKKEKSQWNFLYVFRQ